MTLAMIPSDYFCTSAVTRKMRIMSSARNVFGVLAAIGILGGCSAGGSQLTQFGAPPQSAAQFDSHFTQSNGPIAMHSDRPRSWMDPGAKKDDLYYISDNGTDDVYVYANEPRKGKRLVGTLTDFSAPKGMCADKAGDVFITNQVPRNVGPSDILEYAHGGASPIATLTDAAYYPYGCSVDPMTGNLAVTNASNATSYGPGDVVIYKNATGLPTNYPDSEFNQYFFCGYDSKGNLFVDGISYASGAEFAKLPNGSENLEQMTLKQSFQLPGAVQWDGKHLAVGDSIAGVIYRFKIRGDTGTMVGTTPLDGSNYIRQFWIYGAKVAGANNQGASVDFWNYPAGGTATGTIGGFKYPTGVTVSLAKQVYHAAKRRTSFRLRR